MDKILWRYSMSYQDIYNEWLTNPYFDDETKAELKAISNDEKEIEERFYKELEFGTAGLRGIIGAGTNRMNYYTVRKATQGLANYIVKMNGQERGVAIAYDSRHMSPEFADAAALCLNANGIKAYVFDALRPTPELSFAVRELGCISGINVTASHNPAAYNGYKVYWEDGAQVTPPHDVNITDEVNKVGITDAKTMDKDEAIKAGLYVQIGKDIDDRYISELKKLVRHQDAIDAVKDDVKIVYTPLHGAGNILCRRILDELGFKNVYVVKEQELPNGDFPTCPYPNPEAAQAFELAVKLGTEVGADLLLATDPDCDRIGIYVKGEKPGEYHPLTGNMQGCLLAEYEIGEMKATNTLTDEGALIKTIVSTDMANDIAAYYGVQLIEVLTGFKYIGEQILKFEQTGKGQFCLGFEESYGYLVGTHARDKDAVVAVMAFAEAAAYYKTQGLSLYDKINEMFERYGYWQDQVKSITLEGKEGIEKIGKTIENLRSDAPTELGGYKVLKIRDYKLGTIKTVATSEEVPTGLPESNVLYYELEEGAWVAIRPSGTEPKLKFYYGLKGSSEADAKAKIDALGNAVVSLVENMMK